MTHKLLERQLRKIGDLDSPQAREILLRTVSRTYEEYDRTQRLQDNATQLMSDELNALNAALRKERDETVATTQKRFELAVEGANDGIWDWNVAADSLWLSPRAKTMLGYKPEKMAQCSIADWYDLVVPEDRDAARAIVHNCLEKHKQQVATLQFAHEQGGVRHIMCRASCVLDDAGNVLRIVGIHTDITPLILMNEELKRTKTLAESANAAKSDFLANISHELRTPLNSILGMTRLLIESGIVGEQKELADMVYRSSTNLLDIVNDILDLSKIEAGEMTLESAGFDITYTFDSVITSLSHLAQEKRLPVKASFDRGSFPYVLGDPLRVTRVLMNLISNAIKYTDEGHVELRAFCKKIDDNRVEVRCEVQDTGIGISRDHLEKVFEKFVQADTSTTRRFGGTGLGLAITRELVELMGGKIGVESELGEGAMFWFTIPFQTTEKLTALRGSEKRARRRKGDVPAKDARVLIAEDHPLNQVLVSKLMEKFGVGYYEIVNNGREALEKCATDVWHVVLMDCHMPEMSGYETTRHVRLEEEGSDKRVPIVAMTANAMVGEKEKCLRYGMDDYISKPLDADVLKDILGQWLIFSEADPSVASAHEETAEGTQVVDPQFLKNFSDGDKEMEKDLVRIFIEQSDQNIAVLETSIREGAEDVWRDTAHMLKGGAAGIGASRMSVFCDRMQNFKGNAEALTALQENIVSEYARVKEFFKTTGLLD